MSEPTSARVDVQLSVSASIPLQQPASGQETDPMGAAPQLHVVRPEPLPGQQELPFDDPTRQDRPPTAAGSAAAPTGSPATTASPASPTAVAGRLPTLREAYQAWWLTEKQGDRKAATFSADRTALARWEAACRELAAADGPRARRDSAERDGTTHPVALTADPPVDAIDRALLGRVLAVWRGWGVRRDSLRKWFSTIKKTLRAGVEREALDRLPPFPELPRAGKQRFRGFAGGVELEEVDRLYRAAEAAHWPRLARRIPRKDRYGWLTPAVWWRAWLVLWWTYGLRTQDVVGVRGAETGLLWEEITEAPACPLAWVRTRCPTGWLYAFPGKTEETKGEPIVLPLSACVRRHLAVFRPAAGLRARPDDPPRVFPHGRSPNDFYRALREIKRAAGVGDDVYPSAPRKLPHGLQAVRSIRKGCSQNWDDVKDGLGAWVLGHVSPGTNAESYKSVAKDLVAGVEDLPLPPSFRDESLLPKVQHELPAG